MMMQGGGKEGEKWEFMTLEQGFVPCQREDLPKMLKYFGSKE